MGLQVWKRWLVINSALALLAPAVVVSGARAEDEEVSRRLGKYGKLSNAEARKVVSAVSGRMKRAADMTNNDDPLRSAVSTALFGSSVPADAMAAAKVRLRLYAGLNEWALDSLFAPRPGALATCTSQFGLRGPDCEALLAASGRMSPGEASRLGGGRPVAVANAPAPQPMYAPAAPQAQQSRFGRYDSGFRGGAQPQQGYGAARPAYGAQQPMYGARPMPARPMPAARPMQAAPRPMPVARPAAPPPNPAMVANRKAEYERKRQEYLERKKAEMAARKEKIVATAGGTAPVQRGPTSAAEAEAVGLDPAEATAAAAPAKGAAKTAAKSPAAAPEEVAQAPAAEAPKSEKPALDGDFLDGLMDNPLGSKK